MKFKKKSEIKEALTFEEFKEYAKNNSNHPHWNFQYKGLQITHENDNCYIIKPGVYFTSNDILVTDADLNTYPISVDIFNTLYSIIEEPKSITDQVKTVADAFRIVYPQGLSLDMKFNPTFKGHSSVDAYVQLIVIAEALNEGWEPDWSNSNQVKYMPWFKHKPGFGLSLDDVVDWDSGTDVDSRLCYKTRELAQYAATQFADIYNDYFSIKK